MAVAVVVSVMIVVVAAIQLGLLMMLVIVVGMVVMLMLRLVLVVSGLVGALKVFCVHLPPVRQDVSKGTLYTEFAITLLEVLAWLGVQRDVGCVRERT